MQIVIVLGVVMFLISIVLGSIFLVQKIMGQALGGFTTVILIQLFFSNIIMISLGIMGYYIAKIYEEIKGRPRYIVGERIFEKEQIDSQTVTIMDMIKLLYFCLLECWSKKEKLKELFNDDNKGKLKIYMAMHSNVIRKC